MLHCDYTEVDSTNDRALALASLNPGRAILVSARTQTRGRGRTGRPWASPVGGAWLTLAWPVREDLPPERYEPVPLVAGLAALQTIAPLLDDAHALAIKWPNDLLLGGGKLAGILCERVVPATPRWLEAESSTAAREVERRACLLVGVGVNVNNDPGELGQNLRHPPTSLLAHTGRRVELGGLVGALGSAVGAAVARLEEEGLTPEVLEAIEARLAWRGEPVSFVDGGQRRRGVCMGLDARGGLVIQEDGRQRTLHAGEVQRLTPAEVC